MAETVTHNFVSAKSDSPDTTLVSATEWNDGHVFSGGINGQVLIYDNTQPNNIRWTDGATRETNLVNIANPTTSPLTQASLITITPASNVIVGIHSHLLVTTTGAVTYVHNVTVDGGSITADTFTSGLYFSPYIGASLTAGAHTIGFTLTSTGAATFTGSFVAMYLLVFGV